VQVQAGSARLTLPVERLRAAASRHAPAAHPRATPRRAALRTPNTEAAAAIDRCDLRGLRVDEALDQLQAALDRAALGNRARLAIVHGIGTGALRDAVQRFLRESPYVTRSEPAAPNEGGDGVTIAVL
jgi:DNA mismatch repair protein MutS2